MISRIAALHLAPHGAQQDEPGGRGIDPARIFVTGNTAIDALRIAAGRQERYTDPALADLENDDADGPRVVARYGASARELGAPLERIADAVGIIAESHPEVRFVVALHPNPVVGGTLTSRLERVGNVSLVKPMAYAEFARLLQRATIAITDSGRHPGGGAVARHAGRGIDGDRRRDRDSAPRARMVGPGVDLVHVQTSGPAIRGIVVVREGSRSRDRFPRRVSPNSWWRRARRSIRARSSPMVTCRSRWSSTCARRGSTRR